MTCAESRPLLPLFVTADLEANAAARLERHLADCEACRAEAAALRGLLAKLDEVPAPEAQLDLPALFGRLQAAEAAKARRWRRLALAGVAVAAALLLFVAARLELRLEEKQFVVTWGQPVASKPALPPQRQEPLPVRHDETLAAKVRELEKLVDLAFEDAADRDGQRRQEIAALKQNLDQLRRAAAAGIASAERDLSALYATVFPKKDPKNPGENP